MVTLQGFFFGGGGGGVGGSPSLVHTTPDEFENLGFPLKTRQMSSVHTTPEELKNATIVDHFGFVFDENTVRDIT